MSMGDNIYIDENGWAWAEDPNGDHVAFRAPDGGWVDGVIDVDRITDGRHHLYTHGQPDRLGRGTVVRLRLERIHSGNRVER